VLKPPAEYPHADCHSQLNFVLNGHRLPGWVGCIQLLTRWSQDSDFAADSCLLQAGTDLTTGERHLEALAFEIVYEPTHEVTHEWRSDVRDRDCIYKHTALEIRERAEEISLRGVPFYGIFVEQAEVRQWSAQDGVWESLPPDAFIEHEEHEAFVRPMPVKALLEAEEADKAVYEALAAKADPVFAAMSTKRAPRAARVAKTQAIATVLAARGLTPSDEEREKIQSCYQDDVLDRWLARAVVVDSVSEIFAGETSCDR